MIGISTLTYDLDGHVIIREGVNSQNPVLSRRVTRTATLDGKATLNDLGFSDSDGTFFLSMMHVTQDQIDTLRHMIQNYSKLMLCFKHGAFEGVISSLDTNSLPILATFLIEKKVSE
jgi:hypothetical protein